MTTIEIFYHTHSFSLVAILRLTLFLKLLLNICFQTYILWEYSSLKIFFESNFVFELIEYSSTLRSPILGAFWQAILSQEPLLC